MINSILIKTSLCILLIIALLAPFTFLKNKIVPDVVIEKPIEKLKKNKEDTSDVSDIKTQQEIKTNVIKKVFEKPLHKVKIPDFAEITDIKTKKKKFFEFLKPFVTKKNNELLMTRKKLQMWYENTKLEQVLSNQDQQALNTLVKKYRVNQELPILAKLNDLLLRVDIIPVALVLVQAANESAWGTSRFSRIGLNFFGIWCYQKGCGMVPNSRNTGADHEVAAFKSLNDAINGYFDNINSNNAYQVFRTLRFDLRAEGKDIEPNVLVNGLLPYSERGADYVVDISNMLRQNKHYFTKEQP